MNNTILFIVIDLGYTLTLKKLNIGIFFNCKKYRMKRGQPELSLKSGMLLHEAVIHCIYSNSKKL